MSNNDLRTLMRRVAELEAERDQWQHVAEHDPLTDLPNRRQLERRTHAREGWFVMVDLCGFKQAQDSHPDGHLYGDRVLQEFSRWAESLCSGGQRFASRLGGDEFVVWCPTHAGAERIQDHVRRWKSHDTRVAARAGIGKTLSAADAAMYATR